MAAERDAVTGGGGGVGVGGGALFRGPVTAQEDASLTAFQHEDFLQILSPCAFLVSGLLGPDTV